MTSEKEKRLTNGKSKIAVTKDGPYIVAGAIPISEQVIIADSENTATEWRQGKKYPLREKCALCRCGQSNNKPFCDGTHLKVGFYGTETAVREGYHNPPKEVNGQELKLTDFEELCASARFCHRAGGIWDLVPKSEDQRKRKIIIEEACDCPSGRLVIYDKKNNRTIEPEFEKSIGLIEDPTMGVSGPIWVRGGVRVESADGKTYMIRNRITLCRCGKSQNKPFCDSSHYPEEHEHGESSNE